jgi:N-acetylmuramoyl-L-alanine amidase
MRRTDRRRTVAVVTGLGVVAIITAAVVGSHLVGTHPSATGATGATVTTATTVTTGSTTGPTRAAAHAAAHAAAVPARSGAASAPPTSGPRPLAGRVVVLDPGHNGDNAMAASTIDQMVWNGREMEACDTTGTETNAGYTESRFNFAVATLAQADLEAEGATVLLTRSNDTGVGPCITQRTAIGNQARADAVVSIHADGGPSYGRGYALLLPVDDGVNAGVVGSSTTLGIDLRNAFLPATGMPISNYDGIYGLQSRDDLAGTNLTTVPKVFIECGNMRNAADAALLTDPAWQARAAQGITTGITDFLTSPSR